MWRVESRKKNLKNEVEEGNPPPPTPPTKKEMKMKKHPQRKNISKSEIRDFICCWRIIKKIDSYSTKKELIYFKEKKEKEEKKKNNNKQKLTIKKKKRMFETSHATKSTSTPVNLLVKLWLFYRKRNCGRRKIICEKYETT